MEDRQIAMLEMQNYHYKWMQVTVIGARDCLAWGKGLSNFFGCLGLHEYQILSQVLVTDNFAICTSEVYRLEAYISSNCNQRFIAILTHAD
jgi:hypothetical protein